MNNIHATAVIDPKAKLGDNITVGPYAVIEADVEIDDNCWIGPHAGIYNGARLAKNVKIYQSASVSNDPHDLKYDNEETYFYVGENTVVREFVTLHKGTVESGKTVVGKDCLLMAYAHIAHDCIIGDKVILANSVQVGGHVEIGEHVIIGGATPVHQFSTIGKHAMVAGGFRVTSDIPPYVMAAHEPMRYAGLNVIGLRRRGFSNEDIAELKKAYALLYDSGLTFSKAKEELREKYKDNPVILEIPNFLDKAKRSVIRK